jgi:hypothetical protein
MTVIPDKHTFTIWQGATFYEVLTLFDSMDRTQPRDLTGYAAEMIIRDKPQGTPLLTLSTIANGGSITNGIHPSDAGCSITLGSSSSTGTKGKITLKITASATTPLPWKSGVYDLTISEASGTGNTDALLYGGIKVNGV